MDCLTLTRALIERASVTPEDAGCQTLLAERLAAAGFGIAHLRFGEVDNLWAWHGESGPTLALVGHTDVVPPGPLEDWQTPPFEPSERDGMLYGRGAADMKAAVAAQCLAAEAFVRAHPDHPGRIALCWTSDEEGPAHDGIKRVVEWLAERALRIDYALIGEPSSEHRFGDRIRNGRRGSLHGYLTVRGQQGHVAYPQLARNPIHLLAPALSELASFVPDAGNAHFPPSTFQIYQIQAGAGANNVIPGELQLAFNSRFGTASSLASIEAGVRELLDRHGLDFDLRMRLSSAPFLTADGALLDAVQDSLQAVLGQRAEADTGGGTSDGRFLAPAGAQVVELGPLNATIHKADECVPVDCMEPMVRVYGEVIERLLLGSEAK
jgi:succinyl-diaminopimelate desuccinylase